jgi:2-polyprenyl-6-methoxyphenol hydroxylase-like FAD-dependent oxidoreductase
MVPPANHRNKQAGQASTVMRRGRCRRICRGLSPVEQAGATDHRGDGAHLPVGIYDRAPLKTWSTDRITLLGDAAHAVTPHLGQGANQAV